MRDRLIELLGEFPIFHSKMKERWMPEAIERLASHLLAEGVIVPMCKVGDVVYIPDKFGRMDAEIERIEITECGLCYEWVKYDRGVDEVEVWDDGSFEDADIGKTVFLSREQAEAAFAEREGEE